MSVILFTKSEVFQEMADEYEGLKHLQRVYGNIDDEKFYKSLRRLYFANVATFLCQYHDDSPISSEELQGIETFQDIEGEKSIVGDNVKRLNRFLDAWNSLQYNLITNDGEKYVAKESEEYIKSLIDLWTKGVLENLPETK